MNTKLFDNKMNRRQLLGNLGKAGAGAALATTGLGSLALAQGTKSYDAAILTFALNLEYLEAAFYLASIGRIAELTGGDAEVRLPEGFDGTTSITFDNDAVAQYADEIATDEINHVNFLRTALGNILKVPVADRPVIDLNGAFAAAANAAFPSLAPLDPVFNPFDNELFFLHGAFIFEDVGVTAYKGAAPLVKDKATVLANAAGILAVEAYHAGEIRTLLYARRTEEAYPGVTVEAVVNGISALRGLVGGGKDQGIVVDGKANIVPTDDNAVAYSRTPREVANIVFLDTTNAALKGGFFPDGLSIPAELAADFAFLLSIPASA